MWAWLDCTIILLPLKINTLQDDGAISLDKLGLPPLKSDPAAAGASNSLLNMKDDDLIF